MIKNNKLKIAVASVVTVLPMLFGLIMWNKLPDVFTIHWAADGTPDGFASKAVGVFLMPAVLVLLFWLCLIITAKDPKNKNQSPKAITMVIWVVPAISVIMGVLVYGTALGFDINVSTLMCLLVGFMAITVGNYLPKCKQNYTIGIKIAWTLNSEENWNATHRFAGKVWFICGIFILVCAFLPSIIAAACMLAILVIMVALPFIYSYNYHKKEKRSGE